VAVNWQLIIPSSPTKTWSFSGVVTDLGHQYKLKEAVMADVTIKVSGKPVLA
jgi:hypothetical protein